MLSIIAALSFVAWAITAAARPECFATETNDNWIARLPMKLSIEMVILALVLAVLFSGVVAYYAYQGALAWLVYVGVSA